MVWQKAVQNSCRFHFQTENEFNNTTDVKNRKQTQYNESESMREKGETEVCIPVTVAW